MSTVDLQIKCDIMTPNVSEMYRNVEHLGCVGTKGGSDLAGSYRGEADFDTVFNQQNQAKDVSTLCLLG